MNYVQKKTSIYYLYSFVITFVVQLDLISVLIFLTIVYVTWTMYVEVFEKNLIKTLKFCKRKTDTEF
jgi:hypothetical protein